MESAFTVLIHASLYGALKRLPAVRRSALRRVLDNLRAGRWAGGTRVKKLRGCAKPVFEARHDGGDRVLFTCARSAPPDGAKDLRTCLQVWDVVPHDRVDRGAARINRAAEAEFLDYSEVESELITEPPPLPALAFDDLAASADPASPSPGLVELMLPPEGLGHGDREEITGGIRWYLLPERLLLDDGEWQQVMDGGAEDLELKLTAEQYAVVHAPGPVLLTGSAGSGKTTIAVHRLVAASCGARPARVLYVTYSAWLLDYARRLFHDLCLCRGVAPPVPPDFLTFHGLYGELIARHGGAPPARVADFAHFARWYGSGVRRGDTALAWEEIRSIVKGACLDAGHAMLRRGRYEALGRKRAPLFVGERERLFETARRWQDYLERSRLEDEIDVCRRALARLRAEDAWDHVICDEAQDLAEIQVELLLRLHPGRGFEGLFLAGDPQQVINPSGFRWAEVRSAIRERFLDARRPTPALYRLEHNFRSVRGLVDLANEVLAVKRDRTGRSEGDEPEECTLAGPSPVLVEGDEAALAGTAAGFGPRCAVVAGSGAERDRLQALLASTRIFTVPEAKGLEFDVVILWGLIAADPDPWLRVLSPGEDLREDPACRRALHHLYVAITRARRHLAIFDPPSAPPLWRWERFARRLEQEPVDSLSRLFVRSASPEEWLREGEYFLERGRHRQAAECFRRAGIERRELECLALHHQAAGELAAAAEIWRRVGESERAASCLEQAGLFAEAARVWHEVGDARAARRSAALAAEAARRWQEAAGMWEALDACEEAARCWAGAGNRPRQLQCLARLSEREGRLLEAAQRWREAGVPDRAAALLRRAGSEQEALRLEAEALETARRWEPAASAWERAGEAKRAVRCRAEACREKGQWAEGARLFEALDDLDTALRMWKRAGEANEVRRCGVLIDLAGGRFVRAAEELERMEEWMRAAGAWSKAGEAGQRPKEAAPLPLPPAAREPWIHGTRASRLLPKRGTRNPSRGRITAARQWPADDPKLRALACSLMAAEAAGRFDEAEKIWTALRDPGQTLRCRVAFLDAQGRPAEAAALLEQKSLFHGASQFWCRAGDARRASRCEAAELERLRRFGEALALWEEVGDEGRAAGCRARLLQDQGRFEEAAAIWDKVGEPDSALTCRLMDAQISGDGSRAVVLLTSAGLHDQAIRLKKTLGQWEADGRRMARAFQQTAPAGPEAPAAGGKETLAARGRPPMATKVGGPNAEAALKSLVEAVRTYPGATCENLSFISGIPTSALKPLLRRLVLDGRLQKTGQARGTRYRAAQRPPPP